MLNKQTHPTHACIHMHTHYPNTQHAHTCAHTDTHVPRAHACACMHMLTYIQDMCMHTHTHMLPHAHIRACIHMHTWSHPVTTCTHKHTHRSKHRDVGYQFPRITLDNVKPAEFVLEPET